MPFFTCELQCFQLYYSLSASNLLAGGDDKMAANDEERVQLDPGDGDAAVEVYPRVIYSKGSSSRFR